MRAFRWVAIAGVVAAVGLTVVLATGFGGDPSLTSSPLIGEPAPQAELRLLDGHGSVKLVDSETINVINFWAPWCLQCRREHDDLLAAASVYGDRVSFASVLYNDSPANGAAYLDQEGRSDDTRYLIDEGLQTAISYGVFGIPETFFVDSEGTVVGVFRGETDALVLSQAIEAVLAGQTPGEQVLGPQEQAPRP